MATPSQYRATGRFHERMARALEAAGKRKDAESARRAADLCRRNAESPL